MERIKLTILAILISLGGCAGMERATDSDKPVEFVLEAPNKTKDQLFSASKSWIAETFVSGKSVIDDADKDSGRIIAKAIIKKPCDGVQCALESGWKIGFTLRIDTKDGKIRTTYTNPIIITPSTSGSLVGSTYVSGSQGSERPISLRGEFDDAKKAFRALSDELQSYVTNESTGTKNF